jgi:excinuclease ABC subunit C
VDGLIRDRQDAMREAAREMDFERAAKLRDEVSSLSYVRDRQQATIASEDSFDAIGAFARGESACVQVFAVREGQIVNRDSFLLDNYGESRAEDVALQFVPQYYGTAAVPREVLLQSDEREEELATLAAHLSGCEARGSRCAARGGGTSAASWRWPCATRSRARARAGLEEAKRNKVASTLDGLREELALPSSGQDRVLRHLQHHGDQLRGLDGRLSGGRPAKGEYRRFRIRTVEGADDFASMAEVIRRRPRTVEGERREVPGARPDPARRRQGPALRRPAGL